MKYTLNTNWRPSINLVDASAKFGIRICRYRKRDTTTVEITPKALKMIDATTSLFQLELPDDISIESDDVFYTSVEVLFLKGGD